jgi:hypothetical protein
MSSNERYAIGISDFETQEEKKGFERVEPSVNEITCERLAIGNVLEM